MTDHAIADPVFSTSFLQHEPGFRLQAPRINPEKASICSAFFTKINLPGFALYQKTFLPLKKLVSSCFVIFLIQIEYYGHYLMKLWDTAISKQIQWN